MWCVFFFFFMGLVGKKEKTVQKNKGKKKRKKLYEKTASIWNWRKECILRTAEFFLLHI